MHCKNLVASLTANWLSALLPRKQRVRMLRRVSPAGASRRRKLIKSIELIRYYLQKRYSSLRYIATVGRAGRRVAGRQEFPSSGGNQLAAKLASGPAAWLRIVRCATGCREPRPGDI